MIFPLMLVFSGCPNIETIPEIPEISFESFSISLQTDKLENIILAGDLKFHFQDGDGDIGIGTGSDTLPVVQDSTLYNLFFTLYNKVDGEYEEIPNDTLPAPLFYRIPFMETEGNNRTLKGEIDVVFEYLFIEYDTIRYTFFLTDRAGHNSNVDTTTDISFTEWKL